MLRYLWTSTRMLAALLAVIGVYVLAVSLVGPLLFPRQAAGSLVHYRGQVVGSELIGQAFTQARFFNSRPSAAAYNGAASTATNYGPTNPALLAEVKSNLATFLKMNPGVRASQVPPSMVESSDSGLDPDITPAAAYLQAPRVARTNHLPLAVVRGLIARETRGRFLGMFGLPTVNVLELNLALLRRLNG